MTPNEVYGVTTTSEQQQSVSKIELTQNQVYGVSDEAKIELTQNQVFGMSGEARIELTQNQVYGVSQRDTNSDYETVY